MTSTIGTIDRCELCNYRLEGGARDRVRHLKGSHPRYARGLLLRLAAPLVFVVAVVALGVAGAPQVAFLAAFAITFGMLFFGKQISRSARSQAGARPTLPIRRLAREGGLAIALLIPILALIVLVLAKI